METTTNKKYIEAVGRRKTSTARVRLVPASKNSFTINDREGDVYFPTTELRTIIRQPLEKVAGESKYAVSVHVNGGGIHSQAEAIRHGVSRVLVKIDEDQKTGLKKAGFLKRDPRSKERRKFGLKKARKAPQWSKR